MLGAPGRRQEDARGERQCHGHWRRERHRHGREPRERPEADRGIIGIVGIPIGRGAARAEASAQLVDQITANNAERTYTRNHVITPTPVLARALED